MEDSYEARALFLMIWHGGTDKQTQEMFPEWREQRFYARKTGYHGEMGWLRDFTQEALAMKNK